MPRKPSAPAVRPASLTGSRVWAGTSGWAYPTWKPGFYPDGVPARRFLEFYSSQLSSVEVNYTFTKLPSPEQVEGWLKQTPDGFRFSFKAPQRITHFSRLVDCEQHLADLFACLEPVRAAGKLGLVLFQLPPNFKVNLERLAGFLELPLLRTVPIAFEFRNAGWFAPEVLELLTRHDAALCVAESEELQTPEVHTSSTHVAFRLRRTGGYKARAIKAQAERMLELAATRQVYAYFKHEEEPTGALNARALLKAVAARAPAMQGKPKP